MKARSPLVASRIVRFSMTPLSLLLGACAGVLGLRAASDASHPFEHHAHLIQGISCVKCHDGLIDAGDIGASSGADALHIPTTQKCLMCHERPHTDQSCNDCHGQASTRQAAIEARKHLTFTHKQHLGRLETQCVPCHVNAGSADAESMRPTMARCFTCHAHQDQWTTRSCDGCHKDLPAERSTPASHVVHEGNFAREHGVRAASSRELCSTCHSESSCTSCHGATVAALPKRLRPESPSLGSLHPAGFLTRHPEESRGDPALCSSCHAESFCTSCHESKKVTGTTHGRNPHPAGWVRAVGGDHGRAARLDPLACASCHGGAGESLCVGCHRVGGAGGSPHGPGFKSVRDKVRDEPCRKCHAS